ncbi:MAG: 3-oxoacyl-ACP synthase [Bacteroidetes bacterium]|nr:3-oxoacyl-ACP synthase [Bacteroidota bacterium]
MITIKEELYKECFNYVQECIDTAQQAIDDAIESANEDTKSSAGDKFETGREMIQQEIDRSMKQLEEAKKQKISLQQIEHHQTYDSVQNGSLVSTNFGKFYISISKGQIRVQGANYFAISCMSPIGMKLMRQKIGHEFDFNGKLFRIEDIQ